jgi:hypothetical protein
MELSLVKGTPLASYTNKLGKKKFIYSSEDTCGSGNIKNIEGVADYIEKLMNDKKIKLSDSEIKLLGKALKSKNKPASSKLGRIYDDITLVDKKSKVIHIENGDVMPVWNPDCEREVFYIAGMSGSGKSVFAGKLINNYKKLFPKNNVFLFSNKPEDPALDKEKIFRIGLDDDLLDDQFDLNDLRNKLIVFDDVEANKNKYIQEELDRLRDLILQQGRSYHISFIYISHLLNDGKKTRTIINESHKIVVFPKYTTFHSLSYCLERYLGFGKPEIKRLKELKSRYACISKFPQMSVVHANGAFIVD